MADGDGAVLVGDPPAPAPLPNPEPAPTPQPAPAPAPAPEATLDWTKHIPADYAKDKVWESVKGKPLADVLKNHAEAQRYLGNVISLPKKDAKPEEVAAWRKEAMGKLTQAGLLEAPPEKPEAYQIERPPIVTEMGWSDDREGHFRTTAHALGLTQAQVQGLVAWQADDLTRGVQAAQQAIETATEELSSEWGANFDAKLGRAEQFLNAYFPPEVRTAIKKSGINNLPGFIKGCVAAGSRFAEHGDLPGTVEGQPSPADLKGRADEIRAKMKGQLLPAERTALAEELHGVYQQLEGDNNRVHLKVG